MKILEFGAALCFGVLGTACSHTTPIAEIMRDARSFDGTEVQIEGTVTNSLNVLVVRGYTVSDGTGEILVVTIGAVPSVGAAVRVRGSVQQAFSFADKNLIVLREAQP